MMPKEVPRRKRQKLGGGVWAREMAELLEITGCLQSHLWVGGDGILGSRWPASCLISDFLVQ